MRKIKEIIEKLDSEIKDAKEKADEYAEFRLAGDSQEASASKQAAMDELKHADLYHSRAVKEIQKISQTFQNPPQKMLDKWNRAHHEYIDQVAFIKQILSM